MTGGPRTGVRPDFREALGIRRDVLRPERRGLALFIAYAAVFLLALSLRAGFAYLETGPDYRYALDAAEYARSASALAAFLQAPPDIAGDMIKVFSGSGSYDSAAYEPLKEMVSQSGVIYPLFLVLAQKLFGQPVGSDFSAAILLQCMVSALACVFVGLAARRCFDCHRIGLSAAVLAAVYPGFIVNCPRLLSETLAAFFVSLALYLAIEVIACRRWKLALGLGMALAALELTRPALVLVGLAFTGIMLMRFSDVVTRRALVLLVLGAVCTVAPVMALQKLTLGQSSVVQDRKGLYNLAVGTNPDTSGWLAYPFMSFAGLDGPAAAGVLATRVIQRPLDYALTAVEKPYRLLAFPWNDFKKAMGGGVVTLSRQILFHQVLLYLALIGLALGLGATRGSALGRLLALSLVLVHAGYFFFSTLGRYGVTAMPAVLIFSAAGLYLSGRLIRRGQVPVILCFGILFIVMQGDFTGYLRAVPLIPSFQAALLAQLGIKLVCALVFLAMVALCEPDSRSRGLTRLGFIAALVFLVLAILPVRACGRSNEWIVELEPHNQALTQVIDLAKIGPEKLASRDCYLLLDCRSWKEPGQLVDIFVNEKRLESPAMPLMPFVQESGKREFEYVFSRALNPVGAGLLDLRQWFAIKLPLQSLSGANKLTVHIVRRPGKSPARFYGSYLLRRDQVLIPSLNLYSWDKCLYGVEQKDGLCDPRFDERYPLPGLTSENRDLSQQPGLQAGTYNLRLLLAPSGSSLGPTRNLASRSHVDLPVSMSLRTKLPPNSLLTVAGVVKSSRSDSFDLPIAVKALVKDRQGEYQSPWVPTSLALEPGSNNFAFSFPVMLPEAVESEQLFDLEISSDGEEPAKDIVFERLDLNVSELEGSASPISGGYEIY
ncbi:MAG: ArnT family glycosyltransferase [Candidatus Obscuribacterales bacterium]